MLLVPPEASGLWVEGQGRGSATMSAAVGWATEGETLQAPPLPPAWSQGQGHWRRLFTAEGSGDGVMSPGR